MLRKLSLAIAGTMLISGAAAAAQDSSPFPMSGNETGVYQPETYVAPSATRSAAAAPFAESSTFPISVNEVGPNYPNSAAYGTRVAAGAEPSHSEMLRLSESGSASRVAAVDKTVRVGSSTAYINVDHFQTVRLIDEKGQSFVWRFDTLDETHFPLQAIAPRGFLAAHAEIYAKHPYSHLSND